jgi:fluoride exporter
VTPARAVPPPEDAARRVGSPFAASPRRRVPRLRPEVVAVVFLGGIAGGLARYGITEAWPADDSGFPWSTFGVNTAGAFALGLVVALLAEVLGPHRLVRPVVATGFLGAFTTFSSVVTTTDRLLAAGHTSTALIYPASSILAALVAVWLGLSMGRMISVVRARTARDGTDRDHR